MANIPLAGRVTFLLSQLGAHAAARFADLLQPFGLQPRHFGVLSTLAANPGLSQQQLVDMLGIHRNSMVSLVDDLEGAGLLERRRHAHDRRAYALFNTLTATKLLADAQDALDALETEVLGEMSATDQRALVALLSRLVENTGLLPGIHPSMRSPEREQHPATPTR